MKRLFLFLFVLLCLFGLAAVPTVQQVQADEPVIGEIIMWAGSSMPDGWLLCDGSSHLNVDYPELAAALGPVWSQPPDNFGLPDLRDKFPLGAGNNYIVSQQGGEISHTLTISEMPDHRHNSDWFSSSGVGYFASGSGYIPIAQYSATSSSGGGQAHNNMPPYLGVKFIIYTGVLSATPTPTPTPTTPITSTTYLPYISAYTHTLSSGNVLTVPVYFTFGDIVIAGSALLVLAAFSLLLLVRGVAK